MFTSCITMPAQGFDHISSLTDDVYRYDRAAHVIARFRAGNHYRLNDSVFFFQAEDGIRDIGVTGVQTCALPICQPELEQEADERVVEGLQPRDDHRLLEDPAGHAAEALALALLAGEPLDDAHAGHVLLRLGGELGDALLDLGGGRPRAAAVARGDEHGERHRRQRERGEARVLHEHPTAREQDRQRGLGHEDQPVAEEEADRKSTRLNSSHANISYAVFCLKKKTNNVLYLP